MLAYDVLDTDWGRIYIAVSEAGVAKIAVTEEDWQHYRSLHQESEFNPDRCAQITGELQEYLDGRRRSFSAPLDYAGSVFQQKVWAELLQIPYGQVRTYSDVAAAMGHPGAFRAVGQANYHNPLPIIIPCHRVIGKKGNLVGYKGSNTYIKEHLLRLEGVGCK